MAKILIVDDDETLREMLGTAFESEGHEVTYAGDGGSAMDLIRETSFDLVVIDYKLPDKNGPQVLSELQLENVLLPASMVMSSKVSHLLVNECLEAGAKDFVIKPFTIPVLIQRATKILQRAYKGPASA